MDILLSNSRSHFETISPSEKVLRNELPCQDKCMDSLTSLFSKGAYASLTTAFKGNISVFEHCLYVFEIQTF